MRTGYSTEETLFYRTLSEFILDGRAYAGTLDGRAQTARMLVLVTLQKLAASSIAAVRNALRKRRVMLADAVNRSNGDASIALPDEEQVTFDDLAEAEEALPSSAAVMLMEDEIQRLDELVALVAQLQEENRALRQRQDSMMTERATLLQKNEQVRARVEAMIGRLKAMEHNA